MISDAIIGVLIGGSLGLIPFFIQRYDVHKQREQDIELKKIDAAHQYFRKLYDYLAPILKGCTYASIYSKILKDAISSQSKVRREVIYDDVLELHQEWIIGIGNFAEKGYYGLFPDTIYTKVVKLDEKMSEWIKLKKEDPKFEITWEKDSIICEDILKLSEDLRQEIRRLLNVSAL